MDIRHNEGQLPAGRTQSRRLPEPVTDMRLAEAVQAVEFHLRVGDRERVAVVLFETLATCFGADKHEGQWVGICQRHLPLLVAAARSKGARCGQRMLLLDVDDLRGDGHH